MKSKVEKKERRPKCMRVHVYVNRTHMFIVYDVGGNQSSCTHDCAQF